MGRVGILPAGPGVPPGPRGSGGQDARHGRRDAYPTRGVVGLVLALCFFFVAARAAEPIDVWIDTDLAFGLFLHDMDDGFALVRALRSERLRVRGFSASFGNASRSQSLRIARELVARAGRNVPIYTGARQARDYSDRSAAVEALARELGQRRMTIIALGPLTTVAALLDQHPEVAGRIDRVIALAGRTPGYRLRLPGCPYPFADANYEKDPEAVLRVLGSGVPIRLVPWETAQRVRMKRPVANTSDPFPRWMQSESASWFRHWRWLGRQQNPPAFDSALILAAEAPQTFHWQRRRLVVSGDVHTRQPLQPRFGAPHFLLASPEFDSPLEAEFAGATWPGYLLLDPTEKTGIR